MNKFLITLLISISLFAFSQNDQEFQSYLTQQNQEKEDFQKGFSSKKIADDKDNLQEEKSEKTIDIEKEVIAEMNKVRANPSEYATLYIEPEVRKYVGKKYYKDGVIIMTNEGKEAVLECINVLKKTKAVGSLEFDDGLYKMAEDQVEKQGPTGQLGHESPNGDSFQKRAKIFVDKYSTVGENISYGQSTARDIVVSLLVDDGVPSRGHRTNMLNPKFKLAGAAFGNHKVFRKMCVIDYGTK